jgi:hypothetical protein
MARWRICTALFVALAAATCGGPTADPGSSDGGAVPAPDAAAASDGRAVGVDAAPGDTAAAPQRDAAPGLDGPPPQGSYLCSQAVPAGAPAPSPPPAYSGGTCPVLAPGTNVIASGGASREFILVVPTAIGAGESLPLTFLWHTIGTSANIFLERGELTTAIENQRFIAVLPQDKGDLQFRWPVSLLESQARVDEELRFFDDLLACVTQQFSINLQCVSSNGVSTGGLWASLVQGFRSQYLASFMSLSGGCGGVIKPYPSPAHKSPALVLWGGPNDNCLGLFSFVNTSLNLEQNLVADGRFVVECIHNCGHAMPPFDAVPGESSFRILWDFALNHPFWLPPGYSPYLDWGLPSFFPSWCAIGVGNAVPRTGGCIEPSQC